MFFFLSGWLQKSKCKFLDVMKFLYLAIPVVIWNGIQIMVEGGGRTMLQDFMKFCNAAESGGMAKTFILNEEVRVNGEVCTMRGKKIQPGDEVTLGGLRLAVTADENP